MIIEYLVQTTPLKELTPDDKLCMLSQLVEGKDARLSLNRVDVYEWL